MNENSNAEIEDKKFKFNELKVYASTEWLADNKKKYRQVFDRYETSYIYAELSFFNKMYDRENWDVDIELKCYELKDNNKLVCNLAFKKNISKNDHIVYLREGWGNKKEGVFWKKGTYYWQVFINGEHVGTKYFYIEDVGRLDGIPNSTKFCEPISINLYEGQYDDLLEDERQYVRKFAAEQTRYVYAELIFKNMVVVDEWHCELFIKYFNESSELKGQVLKLHKVLNTDETFRVVAGWGSNTVGSWKPGKYSIDIIFMDKCLAKINFEVGDEFEYGHTEVFYPDRGLLMPVDTKKDFQSFEEVYAKLDALIGLQSIKKQVRNHAKYLEFLKLRKNKGFSDNDRVNIHAVFKGNPGTGKTTVARMMGQLYHKMGLLSKGHVVEVDRVDLIGEYIGQTAPKVKEMIEKAKGGVLFIDEAYALARSQDDSKDFGREAIEILVKEMSSINLDMAVIVAGYPKEMNYFMNSNPGLKSRFKHFFEFPDYQPDELIEIAKITAEELEITLLPPTLSIIEDLIISAYRDRNMSFGNARFVVDLLEKAKINMGIRLMSKKNPHKIPKNELSQVHVEDVLSLKSSEKHQYPDLPIDEPLLSQCLAELNNLIGIDQVKRQILDLIEVVKFHKARGANVLTNYSMHTVLVGNPGTGKTTIARILAKIFKALGLLERGHIVETDRQGLVAGYLGQTAIKTGEKVDEALGGVLFVDEAYSLAGVSTGERDFGQEAIQTLLKKMEDLRGKFFVIVAGYPGNMESFLKSNPGLSSRFDQTLHFNDYTSAELFDIAGGILANKELALNVSAAKVLKNYLDEVHQKKDKYFGNARMVRRIMLEVIKQQSLRLSGVMNELKSNQPYKYVIATDVKNAIDAENANNISTPSIGFRAKDH